MFGYGGQFPELEEQTVPGSEPATFREQLTTTSHGIRTPEARMSSFKARRLKLTTRPRRPLHCTSCTNTCVYTQLLFGYN